VDHPEEGHELDDLVPRLVVVQLDAANAPDDRLEFLDVSLG
jgi:hypothetical protein